MRIGTDGRKIPGATRLGPIASLEHGARLGAQGLFFRTVLDMSPGLDRSLLRDIRQKADELGMYVESGLGKVNPYAVGETPELRAAGDGDIVLGFRRMMEACADIGCRELWAAISGFKFDFHGKWCYDRFRTDVTWQEQLDATARFLGKLAPIARDLGIHINIETHEEVTSFELVRLVEKVGPDVVGIVFDTANVLQRVEHPVWSAKRVAPYVRQTHIKDGSLTAATGGLAFQIRTCGTGMVDFTQILPILAAANPRLNLPVENEIVRDGPMTRPVIVEIDDPEFLDAHPDLTAEELEAYNDMVRSFQKLIDRGERPDWRRVADGPHDAETITRSICESMAHLREICINQGLPLDGAFETLQPA